MSSLTPATPSQRFVRVLAVINLAPCVGLLLVAFVANTALGFDEQGVGRGVFDDLYWVFYLWLLPTPLLAITGLLVNIRARWSPGWLLHGLALPASCVLVVVFAWGGH